MYRLLPFFLILIFCLSCENEGPEEMTSQNIMMNCDSLFMIKANTNTLVDFEGEGHAYLYRPTCERFNPDFPPPYGYNYLVIDIAWETFGWTPRYDDILDGVPGIIFGSVDVPSIGDVLEPYIDGPDALYQSSDPTIRYSLGNTRITIAENGAREGEFIGGTISGTITAQDDESDTAEISGSFCVPIFSVCE